jgi:hypothetical protein
MKVAPASRRLLDGFARPHRADPTRDSVRREDERASECEMFHMEHFSYHDVRTIPYYLWRYEAEAAGVRGLWGTSCLSPGFSRSVDHPPTFDVLHAPRFRTARNLGHPATSTATQ